MSKPDLGHEARRFAQELTELLNGTVTNGIRISAVHTNTKASLGYGLGPKKLDVDPIPVTTSGAPLVWLYLRQSYIWDDAGRYLATTSGVMALYSGPEVDDDRLIVSIDYERESANRYPSSHLHVSGHRDDLAQIYTGDRKSRKLRDLHFPVGGKRFRPTLEDMIEFMITEDMVAGRPGWRDVIAIQRKRWEAIQVAAAVRRNTETAADQLREEGWTVVPPSDSHS